MFEKDKKSKHSENDYSDSPVIEVPQARNEGGNETEECVTVPPFIGVHIVDNLRPREDPMWMEVKT